MGMMTPLLDAKRKAEQFVADLLQRLPQSALHRLIAWRTAYPNTPLKYLPLPVRVEVKQILTSAIASAQSTPPARPQSLPASNRHQTNTPVATTSRPSPARAAAPLATVIGTEIATGSDVSITQQAKQQGCYVIGANGTGKTNLLKTMITSDIQNGLGLCLIEPHGDLTAEILGAVPRHRLNDIVYLDIEGWTAPFGLNIFDVLEPRNIRTEAAVASFVSHVFETIWNSGFETPRLMQNLRAATRTLIANPGSTFADIPLLYSSEETRARMLANVTHPHILTFWEEYERMNFRDRRAFTESFLNKVTAFLDEPMISHILSQSRTTIPFRYMMDNAKILLIKLSPQFEEASRLIGAVIIGKLLMTAFSRADTSENRRIQFNLYCDEFHRFASSDFATLISEARKFSISTILSHQTLTQLTEQNRASALAAGTIICFRVSGEDARVIARSYDTTPTQAIVGEEPIRAPAADPLTYLVRHSSPHPVVAKFTAEYLMPLETLRLKLPGLTHPFLLGCATVIASQVIEGYRQLNEALARCMREGKPDVFISPIALFTLAGAADEAAAYLFFKDLKYERWALECLVYYQGFYGTTEYYGRGDFLTPQYEQEDLALLRKMAKVSIFDSREAIAKRVTAFTRMYKRLRATMAILARDPILVDTGSYQPKYQMRTYADMEGEIANSLANQPNYHAKVKIVNAGEYVIRTKPAPEGLTGTALAERIEAVKRHMRALGYTRHYTEVIEEQRKRQEYLFGLGEPPDDDVADDGDDPDEPPPGSFTLD